MPLVTLKFKTNDLKTCEIKQGDALTIGREKDNDIPIENLAVSGHHARIDATADGVMITDLKSKNGTLVNRQAIDSIWLEDGDLITIGKHTLEFKSESPQKAAAPLNAAIAAPPNP